MGRCKYDEERGVWFAPPVPFKHYELDKRRNRWEHFPLGEGEYVPEWAQSGRLTHEQRLSLVTRDAAVAATKMWMMDEGARAALDERVAPSRASTLVELGDEGCAGDFDADMFVSKSGDLELYDYQKAGVSRVVAQLEGGFQSAIIADEMGLGKTPQAVKVMDRCGGLEVLIVCPASLQLNWKREIVRWSNLVEAEDIVIGEEGGYSPVRITSYAKASRMKGRRFSMVTFDEAHALKNPRSKRSQACLFAEDSLTRLAVRVLALTGTPAPNGALDIFWALHLLNPERYPADDYSLFRRVNKIGKRGMTAYDRSAFEAMNVFLRVSGMTRREKAQVLTQLPPKTRRIVEFSTGKGERGLIAQVSGTLDAMQGAESFEDKARIGRLEAKFNGGVMRSRRELSLARVPHISRYVSDTSSEGESIIFFCVFRETMEALKVALGGDEKVAMIHGSVSLEDRQRAVDDFQAGRKPYFIGQVVAAGAGLTLTRSQRTIFVDIDWTPANMEQAEDRNHRIGQEDAVLIEYPCFFGSLDHHMVLALLRKTKERKVVRGG